MATDCAFGENCQHLEFNSSTVVHGDGCDRTEVISSPDARLNCLETRRRRWLLIYTLHLLNKQLHVIFSSIHQMNCLLDFVDV